jgi:hypothetical protein
MKSAPSSTSFSNELLDRLACYSCKRDYRILTWEDSTFEEHHINMPSSPLFLVTAAMLLSISASSVRAVTLSFSSSDFGKTPVFSNVTNFAFAIEIPDTLHAGLYSDPAISDIQYSVSGSLATTPSGFPAFGFQHNHRFPASPPITGPEFYALNASSVPGQTLRFEISASADFSDGIQIDALVDLGGGVVHRMRSMSLSERNTLPISLSIPPRLRSLFPSPECRSCFFAEASSSR